jgi:hypothetical protein
MAARFDGLTYRYGFSKPFRLTKTTMGTYPHMRNYLPRRLSHVIAVPATALVLIDAVAIVLLVSGAVSTVRLGFQTIRRHDIFGAAEIGALLSAIIVVSA